MARLNDDEIREGLPDGWAREGDAIRREYDFDGFPAAVRFVNRVADAAEAANHHPDIDIRYNRVALTLSTHSEGGITEKDLALASEADRLAAD
ncbi:MAG TPA: 4a-hydroxytetrahydrobiopterin dehydratase [Acidimicrobiia bacterium]|nr:4a-hydroxytetrahydrobiopterin dehydratase [Acidimicrobiia bacterium]